MDRGERSRGIDGAARAGGAADGTELRADEAAGRDERIEFIEILPFTPANRNNLIGWIAGRSDEPNYGTAIVYNFPKTRLVDGPLQIEARIDQNAQLSGQLSLWNQQGSHVRRGSLIVMPVGRALLYAEPIYLQAERSPMPELRIVVLALQDRLAYGPTFEAALAACSAASRRRWQRRCLRRRNSQAISARWRRRRPPERRQRPVRSAAGCGQPDLRGRARPGRVPAPDGRGQTRRGGQRSSAEAKLEGSLQKRERFARRFKAPTVFMPLTVGQSRR